MIIQLETGLQPNTGFTLRHVLAVFSVHAFGYNKNSLFIFVDMLESTEKNHSTSVIIIIIRLKARLQPNIGFTLQHVFAVFTRSAITLPKVNRFG